MPLQLEIDYNLTIISEPGFHQHYSTRKLTERLDPTNALSNKAFWPCPETGTLMLYPMQFEQSWLNTANGFDYIITIDQLVVDAADLTSQAIFQFNYQQNQYNPWIMHGPATPGASNPIQGLPGQIDLLPLAEEAEQALSVIGFPGRGAGPPPPPGAGSDMKVLCYTAADLPGNQALYLRWHVARLAAGHSTVYNFYIGQFCVSCGVRVAEVFEDISVAQNKTAWRRLFSTPLFTSGPTISRGGGAVGAALPAEEGDHDASLFWLPYRRNEVLMISQTGRTHRFPTRGVPQLNGLSGNDRDFDIVKPGKLFVSALTPGPSWFQLQKVKWRDGPATLRLPTFTLDYPPATALTAANLIDDADAFHGTVLTHGTPTTPAGYEDRPDHAMDDCPPKLSDPTNQSRTYGVTYTFDNAADTDGRKVFTPFFYGVDIRVPFVAGSWANSSTTIQDKSSGGTSPIAHASIESSWEPGEGRLGVVVHDKPTGGSPAFALADHWYRSNYPVRLFDGATVLFTGITHPNLVEPLRYDQNIHRELTISARDLWKWLEDTTLRDQRDWTGTGHITVVKSIVQQAGISVAGADTPLETSSENSKLGGERRQIAAIAEDLQPGWAPMRDPPDTAATYIKRIATKFANYAVGFYPDGTFYYLPKNFYTASEVTFFKSRAANPAGPCYEGPVEFENVEPEANQVQVSALHSTDGKRIKSAVITDWGSVRNPTHVNFLGRIRTEREPLFINAAFECPQLDLIARRVWDAVRRRHLIARFRADYVPGLKVGRICTLEGQPGTYRVLSYRAEYIREGFTEARYECELQEPGFGPPPP